MRIFRSLLLLSMAVLLTFNAQANDESKKTDVSLSVDVVSRHVWRARFSGNAPCIEPTLNFQTGKFSYGVWGSYALDETYQEVDFYVSYNTPLFEFSLYDFYCPNVDFEDSKFFDFDSDKSVHFFDAVAKYKGCEKFPISIMTSVLFYGEFDRDADKNQRYSTYVELGYSNFIGGKKVAWAMGMTPSKGYYADEMNVVNMSMTVYDQIKFSEQYSLPVRAGVSLNPVQEKLLFSLAFTL
ncbi:hypothetical protein ACXR6G_15730 [Ancylomarina sp. YFZ004]